MSDSVLIGHSLADNAGRLLAIDAAVCEIMQREERELVGMSYTDLTYVSDLVTTVALVEQTRSGARPTVIRKRYVRPDRSLIWSTVQVSRLTIGSDSGRLVGTLQCCLSEPQRFRDAARRAAAMVEQRRSELSGDLFLDHAWAVLLQVYLAECEGRLIDIHSLITADMSKPRIRRWINALVHNGLLECGNTHLQLSASGSAKVERMLEPLLAV